MSAAETVPSTLLIWEEVPESVKLYLIPNKVADTCREELEIANGTYVNNDDNAGLYFLDTALEAGGSLAQYETRSALAYVNITHVYVSGFIL